MTYEIERAWFGFRWRVYEVGTVSRQPISRTWIASLRYEWLARSFVTWRECVADGS